MLNSKTSQVHQETLGIISSINPKQVHQVAELAQGTGT
jgi:hypothetical protein